MKRHESLAPLSREHHGALILAQLLKVNVPNYTGLPGTMQGKIDYAVNFYTTELIGHFKKEEAMLEKVRSIHPSIELLAGEIKEEHTALSNFFHLLEGNPVNENMLDELGNMLDVHIRKEERVLFPLIQQHCTPALLDEIAPLLL